MAEETIFDAAVQPVSSVPEASGKSDPSLTSVLTVAAVGFFFSILAVALAGLTLAE